MACADEAEKPHALARVLHALQPSAPLLFLPDDAPLTRTVDALRACGVDAIALHEAIGFHTGGAHASGYSALAGELGSAAAAEAVAATGATGAAGVAKLPPDLDLDLDLPLDAVEGGAPAAVQDGAMEQGTAAEAEAEAEAAATAKQGKVAGKGGRLLVSTFGSSRGLDLPAVDSVLLFSLPDSADQYLHVAGRTGRQGRSGRVLSLLTAQESSRVGTLTRQLGISIKPDAELALALAADTVSADE